MSVRSRVRDYLRGQPGPVHTPAVVDAVMPADKPHRRAAVWTALRRLLRDGEVKVSWGPHPKFGTGLPYYQERVTYWQLKSQTVREAS